MGYAAPMDDDHDDGRKAGRPAPGRRAPRRTPEGRYASDTDRALAAIRRAEKAGGRNLSVLLTPEAAAALAALQNASGDSARQVVIRALIDAAARLDAAHLGEGGPQAG